VIEAVFEEISVKQQVFAEVEAVVRPDCVLATNTSSLSVTRDGGRAGSSRAGGRIPLLQPGRDDAAGRGGPGGPTDDATLATALAVGKALKKDCVLVKDSPAFVVNRLLTRFLGEILGCVDEGTAFEVAEHAPDPLGLPVPPFLLLQLVGPGGRAARRRDAGRGVPGPVRRLAEAPRAGGGGQDRGLPARLLGRPRVGRRPAGPAVTARPRPQVRERALEALAEEIRLMLDEGVVAAPEDIDLCMILGAGWPFHLGGITPYLDRTGIAEKVTGTRFRL
jgi:3-hydroxyacyl-CoA dehydrogenase